MDIDQILKRSEYFKGISEESRQAVAKMCIPQTLMKKEILFTEGEKGHSLFLCYLGNIQLHKTTPDGREIVIKIITADEIFAEVILFESDCYPVTSLALTKSHVFRLPRQEFHHLLEHEDFRNDFITMLMRKQRYLAEQIKYLTIYDVEERLFYFLEQRFGRLNKIIPGISKKDIAAAIGTTPETLSRLLLRLKNEGKLQWEGKVITIGDCVWSCPIDL